MKKILKVALATVLLVTMLLSTVSCGMESMTGFTRLRDHLISVGKTVELDNGVTLKTEASEDGILVLAGITDGEAELVMTMNGSAEKVALVYSSVDTTATSTLYLTHYTGDELITFNEIGDRVHRENATALCNTLIKTLDGYTREQLDMTVTELGFIVLEDKYMAATKVEEAEEDLGGAFSIERLKQAGLMLLMGMGMVFLVLSVLWVVLIGFKNVFAKDYVKAERAAKAAAKAEKKQAKEAPKATEPAPTPAPATTPATAPAADDGALIAAITAAIAATIESDPDLAAQFVGGFRVVSFKKKNGKTSWNH